MATPQTGIFSLGDAAHIYLEFTRKPGADAEAAYGSVAEFGTVFVGFSADQ